VKSPDWIQELYLKELVHKGINGEKTHDKDRPNAKKTERTREGNRELSRQLQSRTTIHKIR
tara:strand:+ start:182 stop:364 length:183 start_codon:yes stop_codon:yes gene_type:complete